MVVKRPRYPDVTGATFEAQTMETREADGTAGVVYTVTVFEPEHEGVRRPVSLAMMGREEAERLHAELGRMLGETPAATPDARWVGRPATIGRLQA